MMHIRAKKVLCTATILLCAGLLYALIVWKIGAGIPCVIHLLTGLKCPGCGMSRMCLALLRGDVREAFMQNRAAFVLLPALAYVAGAWCVGYIRTGSRLLHGAAKWVAWGIAAVLLAFGVLRNFLGW